MKPLSGSRLLIIAVAAGLFAALLAVWYLKQQEEKYRLAYQPVEQEMVAVVVPKQNMAESELINQNNVAARRIPREFLPANVVLAENFNQLRGRALLSSVQRGRPLTWDALEGEATLTFSETIDLGKRAKAIKVTKIDSFDGLLRPGDRIDLVGNFSAKDLGLNENSEGASDNVVLTVLEDVKVLAAGREDLNGRKYELYSDSSSADGFNMNFSSITLLLSPRQIAKVELAESIGTLVAVLRHPKDTSNNTPDVIGVATLLQPDPPEVIDVVMDANGNVIGRVVGDQVVDADGNVIGKVQNGKAVALDGSPLGSVVENVSEDDLLLQVAERADVLLDNDGNVIGRVQDGQLIDENGNVIGQVNADGAVVGNDGRVLGQVQENVALDANGNVIANPDGQLAQSNGKQVVRNANGEIIGEVVDGKIINARGEEIGTLVDGQIVDANGQVVATNVSTQMEYDGSGPQSVDLFVDFIAGGAVKDGISTVQRVRLQ